MTTQACLFCGGDASEPDHVSRCDGRQGAVEAAIAIDESCLQHDTPTGEPPAGRYSRALAVYRDTSRDAWASVLECLPDVDAQIVNYIKSRDGATSDECERALGLKHQTVSAQIRHMVEAGLLVSTERKRLTQSGRGALVWSLPARGVGMKVAV